MKKTLFAALALVSMASCSNEDVLEVAQKEAIGFENAFVNNSTRSMYDPSFSSAENGKMFSNFQVYGFVADSDLFGADGTTVSGSGLGANGNWTYTETQYWINGAKYNFAAVAPATGWVVKNGTTTTKNQVTLVVTNDGENDVLYAHSGEITGQASDNAKVAFTFNHILSKVKFSFKNSYNASNTKIRVRDIKIIDAYKEGKVVLSSQTATNDETLSSGVATWSEQSKKELVLNFGNAATSAVDAEENIAVNGTIESYNELLLIPGQDTYNVTFIVDVVVDDVVVKTYENHKATINHNFVAGLSYDINAEITSMNIDTDDPNGQESIQFTVTAINDWDNPNGSTTDINASVNTNK